ERGIQGALIEGQLVARARLDAGRDSPAVHRSELQRLEHEHIERALQQLPGGGARTPRGRGTHDLLLSTVERRTMPGLWPCQATCSRGAETPGRTGRMATQP